MAPRFHPTWSGVCQPRTHSDDTSLSDMKAADLTFPSNMIWSLPTANAQWWHVCIRHESRISYKFVFILILVSVVFMNALSSMRVWLCMFLYCQVSIYSKNYSTIYSQTVIFVSVAFMNALSSMRICVFVCCQVSIYTRLIQTVLHVKYNRILQSKLKSSRCE